MTRNMGMIDRGVRIVVALILFWWAFQSGAAAAQGILFWVAVGVGAVMVLTALVSRCPAYRLLGIKTCRTG